MNFATITPSVDWLEVVQAVVCVVAIVAMIFALWQTWGGLKSAIADSDPILSWLGVALTIFMLAMTGIVFLAFENILVQLLVPSALNTQESTLDVVAAINQRAASIGMVVFIAAGVSALGAWMLYAKRERRRRARSRVAAAAAAGLPVVVAPAVVIEAPSDSPAEGTAPEPGATV